MCPSTAAAAEGCASPATRPFPAAAAAGAAYGWATSPAAAVPSSSPVEHCVKAAVCCTVELVALRVACLLVCPHTLCRPAAAPAATAAAHTTTFTNAHSGREPTATLHEGQHILAGQCNQLSRLELALQNHGGAAAATVCHTATQTHWGSIVFWQYSTLRASAFRDRQP
jgi:hypothetical protein